jgi:hypothetical protein
MNKQIFIGEELRHREHKMREVSMRYRFLRLLVLLGLVLALAACPGPGGGPVGNVSGTYAGTLPDGSRTTLHIVDHDDGNLLGHGEMFTFDVSLDGTRTGNDANINVRYMGNRIAVLEGTFSSNAFSGTLRSNWDQSLGSFTLTRQ